MTNRVRRRRRHKRHKRRAVFAGHVRRFWLAYSVVEGKIDGGFFFSRQAAACWHDAGIAYAAAARLREIPGSRDAR